MPDHSKTVRLWVAAGVVAMGVLMMQELSHGEAIVPRLPLSEFPFQLGSWTGVNTPIPPRILVAAGLDEYVSRVYRDPRGGAVTLFISYYRSQRTGETIHSPKNCLPGAGWQPLSSRRLVVTMPGRAPIVMNEYVVARDIDRQLVLYWYQERGRDIASEYAAKFWLSYDALTRDRTDGGLVRVTTELAPNRAQAERRAIQFVRRMDPQLARFIPN
jgi:EpsI family protein